MKKLYLVRHAKSSWKDITLSDFDRPLNKRGNKNAPFMATKLKEKKIIPDLLLSSPAKRAKLTAKYFEDVYNLEKPISYDETLYHPSLEQIENSLEKLSDDIDTVFLFSHNPAINIFVEKYVDLYDNIPTTGVVGILFDTNTWKKFTKSDAQLLMFDFPKNYYDSAL